MSQSSDQPGQNRPEQGADPMFGSPYINKETIDEFDENQSIESPNKKVTAWDKIKKGCSSGWGRVFLAGGSIIAIFAIVVGLSGTNADKAKQPSVIQSPKAPRGVGRPGDPVTEEEAKRHDEVMTREAEKAYQDNKSYQASFEPNIVEDDGKSIPDGDGVFDVDVGRINREREDRQKQQERQQKEREQRRTRLYTPTEAAPIDDQPEPSRAAKRHTASDARSQTPASSNSSTASGQGASSIQAQQREEKRRYEQELRAATAERDRYVKEIKQSTYRNLNSLLERSKGAAFGPPGQYSYEAYLTPNDGNDPQTQEQEEVEAGKSGGRTSTSSRQGKALIKAGQSLYATLDSEANTDESKQIFATIHGGKFNGAKVFGKIDMSQENMTFVFTKLAPMDDRPTMTINAVALREEDAKQGMATEVDHHTLSRYTALAASSLLAGYGRAYSRNTGETIITGSGTVVTNNRRASAREANASAVGEVGQAFSQEIRRGFNRPTTMKTPAETGFALFFLEDVREQ